MQEEETNIYTVGFSDYVKHYEALRQEKKARLLADRSGRMTSQRDESLSDREFSNWPRENVLLSASQSPQQIKDNACRLNSSAIPKFSFARGRSILAMSEYLNSCQSKKKQAEAFTQCMPTGQPVKSQTTVVNLKPEVQTSSDIKFMPTDQYADIALLDIQIMNSKQVSQSPDIQQPISENEPLPQRLRNNRITENQVSKEGKETGMHHLV